MANNKYTRRQKYISTDGGLTFNPVTPPEYIKGELIETDSVDCGAEAITWVPVEDVYICESLVSAQYRWVTVSGEYVCVDGDKCSKEKQQVSYDSGSTWTDTGETRAGSVLESHSSDCGHIVPDFFRKGQLLTSDSSISIGDISSTLGVNEDTNEIYLLSERNHRYGNSYSYTSTTFTADFRGNLYYNNEEKGTIQNGIYFVKNQKVAFASENIVKWRNIGETKWHTSNYFYNFDYNGEKYYPDLCLQYAFGKFLYILDGPDGTYIGKVSMSFDDTPTATCERVVKINPPSDTTIYTIDRHINTYNLTTQTAGCMIALMQNGDILYNYILTINPNSLTYNFIDTGDGEQKAQIRGTILYNSPINYVYYNQHVYNITDNSLSDYINYVYGENASDISPLLLELYGKTYYWNTDNPEKYNYATKAQKLTQWIADT